MDKTKASQIAQTGALYLVNQIQKSGKFNYQRDAMGLVMSRRKYNLLRHCGTIWTTKRVLDLCGLSNMGMDLKLSLAIKYMEPYTLLIPGKGLFVVKAHQAKLGGIALYLLALKEFNLTIDEAWIRGLDFFTGVNGSTQSKYDVQENTFSDFESGYYPGEAALAYAVCGFYGKAYQVMQSLFLNKYKIHGFLPDHWGMQAIEHLIKNSTITGNFQLGLLRQCADGIFYQIQGDWNQYFHRSTPLACRAEALVSYYNITHSPQALWLLKQILGQLASFQNTKANHGAYGAFIDGDKYQIDYTQHAIMAFIKYSKIKEYESERNY